MLVGCLVVGVKRPRRCLRRGLAVAETRPEVPNGEEARAELVYQLVLEGIVTGTFEQGMRLRERELSEK